MSPTPISPKLITTVRAIATPATALTLHRLKNAADLPPTSTHFGGQPYAEAGDSWTICGGCDRPLSFIAQFNMDDCGHASPFHGLFSFYYCQECASWGDIPEDLHDAWLVRHHPSPAASKAVALKPPSNPPWIGKPCRADQQTYLSFPSWEDTDLDPQLIDPQAESPWEIYEAACQAIRTAECLPEFEVGGDPDFKIGGFPRWVQGSSTPECEGCSNPMRFIAEIGSSDTPGLMWDDAGSVYLFGCPKCPGQTDMVLQCY
jgi:hypothetical protein